MTRRLLIVDDLATNRIILKAKLCNTHHEILLASSPTEAREMARQRPVDLVLLDYDMPGMNGVELCHLLRGDPATARVALLMVTSHNDDALRRQALRAGADDVLGREVPARFLQARVRSLLAAGERERALSEDARELERLGLAEPETSFVHHPTIALIGPDPAAGLRWRSLLTPHMEGDFQVLSRDAALRETGRAADLYLIAEDLGPALSSRILISELRASNPRAHAAICLMANADAVEAMAEALDMGADEVVTLGINPTELALRLGRLLLRKRRHDALRQRLAAGLRLALSDPLTGLSNRRLAYPELQLLLGDAVATGTACAVLVLDVDHFKGVNDRFGHAAGDAVLIEIAKRLRRQFVGEAILARLGGDEFLIVMRGCTAAQAQERAETMRRQIASRPLLLPGLPHELAITVSIGIGVSQSTGETAESLLARADLALFAAKAEGRDQCNLRHPSAA